MSCHCPLQADISPVFSIARITSQLRLVRKCARAPSRGGVPAHPDGVLLRLHEGGKGTSSVPVENKHHAIKPGPWSVCEVIPVYYTNYLSLADGCYTLLNRRLMSHNTFLPAVRCTTARTLPHAVPETENDEAPEETPEQRAGNRRRHVGGT